MAKKKSTKPASGPSQPATNRIMGQADPVSSNQAKPGQVSSDDPQPGQVGSDDENNGGVSS